MSEQPRHRRAQGSSRPLLNAGSHPTSDLWLAYTQAKAIQGAVCDRAARLPPCGSCGRIDPASGGGAAPGDERIGEPGQQSDAPRVLRQPPAARLRIAEGALHVQERMLRLGPHRRLALLRGLPVPHPSPGSPRACPSPGSPRRAVPVPQRIRSVMLGGYGRRPRPAFGWSGSTHASSRSRGPSPSIFSRNASHWVRRFFRSCSNSAKVACPIARTPVRRHWIDCDRPDLIRLSLAIGPSSRMGGSETAGFRPSA